MSKTYNNSRYGFSFEYPVNFRVDENPFSIKIISEDSDNYRLTIRVEDLNPHLKKKNYYFSFNKFKACVSDVIRDWCFREGPIGKDGDLWSEVYCTTIAREYDYKNKYGIEVYEFYYNEVTKIRNNEKKAKITGKDSNPSVLNLGQKARSVPSDRRDETRTSFRRNGRNLSSGLSTLRRPHRKRKEKSR